MGLRKKTLETEQENDAGSSTEKKLLLAAQAGDCEAFGKITEIYLERIYRHVFRIIKIREEAEDLTQETFIRAFRYLNSYDPGRSFQNWLYAIATNVALNGLRVQKKQSFILSNCVVDGNLLLDNTGQQATACSTALNPSAQLESQELWIEVQSAIEQLPERSRLLVQLHYIDGMSIRDAGEVIGMREGAAKVALCRARKILRKILLDEAVE